jgi:hypothetical protein
MTTTTTETSAPPRQLPIRFEHFDGVECPVFVCASRLHDGVELKIGREGSRA